MNKKFMGFMRVHRNDITQQEFKMTVIRTPPPARLSPAPSTPLARQLLPLLLMMSGRPPQLPGRLRAASHGGEACCDDWGIDIGRGSESD